MQLSNKTAYFSVKINISLHFCVRCKAWSMKVYFQIKHLNLSDQSKLIESIINYCYSFFLFFSGRFYLCIEPRFNYYSILYISAIFPRRLCRFASDRACTILFFTLKFHLMVHAAPLLQFKCSIKFGSEIVLKYSRVQIVF